MDKAARLDYRYSEQAKKDARKFFRNEVCRVKRILNIHGVPVKMYDHEKIEGHEDALGCAHSQDGENISLITIDSFYVECCYFQSLWEATEHRQGMPSGCLCDGTLAETLCHEFAHLTYWRHGKKHTALTKAYISKVEEAQAGQSLNFRLQNGFQ